MTKQMIVFAGLAFASSAAFGQRIEESSTTFTYNGAWTPTNDPNASAGAYTVSNSAGSTVTFSITGNNFVLYRKVDPNGGYATVTVDGQNFGLLTFYLQETRWQVPAALDQLGTGNHTIVLTVSPNQPAGSGGTNVYFDALQTPAPASLGPSPDQLSAVSRTNFYRNLMGVPPVRHNLGLGLAAVAHAQYLSDLDFISNGISPHVETYGASPDFTGAQPADRDALFGFTGNGGSEDSDNNSDPITFVDGWMDGVYHRSPYLSYGLTETGFGGYPKGSTMDFGPGVLQPLSPAATFTSTFPADGQTDVWPNYGGLDGPSNVNFGASLGYPISLVVSFPANPTLAAAAAAPTTGTLIDSGGNNIPVTVADNSMDGGLSGFWMIPNQPLAVSTMYTAHMTGTDPLMNSFDKTWKFTTANPNSVHSVRYKLGDKSYMANVLWDMTGGAVPSQFEYGPTTAYGTVIPGTLYPGHQSTFQALVPGLLTTAAVTHFRVTAKDAQGNVYASPDHTITVTNALAPATVGFIQVNSNPGDTGMQWETAGPVASTHVNYGLDTTYGMTQAAALFGGYTTWFYLDLNNLTSGATYHYQIVTTDLNGNTLTTPDATFVSQ